MRNTAFFVAGVLLLLVQSNLFRVVGLLLRVASWVFGTAHDLEVPGLVPSLVLPLILFMGVHEYSLARGAGVAFALGYRDINFQVNSTDDTWRGEAQIQESGPYISIITTF